MEKQFGNWNKPVRKINDGIAGGPLILFDPSGDTLIISQMSEFMSTSMHYSLLDASMSFGIMSGVDQVPPEFSADFMVYYSNEGINQVNNTFLIKSVN